LQLDCEVSRYECLCSRHLQAVGNIIEKIVAEQLAEVYRLGV
jgi:hypothetical protein